MRCRGRRFFPLSVIMNSKYQQTIDWLFSQVTMFQNVGAAAYKPGLEGVKTLCDAFGNPHKSIKTIHVGGTNGKGSVSSLIASVLQEAGLKVGLFTSPHLIDFRERIRINGEMISESAVVDFIERYRAKQLDYQPSFFELTTVMAFDWFASNDVDISVIEVGLGGRLDSTNVITPRLSIITNISLDHTALLGNTHEAIAREKSGIIKQGVPVIIGHAEGSVAKVFVEKAASLDAPIRFADRNLHWSEIERNDNVIAYRNTPWGDIISPLTGDCQLENAATVFAALDELGVTDIEAVKRGFSNVIKNTGLRGRWTILSANPRIICDTGHNPGGWSWLGGQLQRISDSGPLYIVAGFVNDKDVNSILSHMPKNATYYWATPSVARGRDAALTRRDAAGAGLKGNAYDSVAEAFNAAKEAASCDATIFIGGSTFVVADFLCYFQNLQILPELDNFG